MYPWWLVHISLASEQPNIATYLLLASTNYLVRELLATAVEVPPNLSPALIHLSSLSCTGRTNLTWSWCEIFLKTVELAYLF